MYSKNELIDWLSEHETAYDDAQRFFGEKELAKVPADELISWIYDHNQLCVDFIEHFDTNSESYDYNLEVYSLDALIDMFEPDMDDSKDIPTVIFNRQPASLTMVDSDMSRLSDIDFEDIDLSKEDCLVCDEWETVSCRLTSENNKSIFERIYAEYFKDIDWIDIENMTVDMSYRKDGGKVVFSASAEKFISSEHIKKAYVESLDLKGFKGETIKKKLLDAETKLKSKEKPLER